MNEDSFFKDLSGVGPDKPMGYIPMYTLEERLRRKDAMAKLIYSLVLKGLTVAFIKEAECYLASGALFAWDHAALTKLLNHHKRTLRNARWPLDADAFVRYSFKHHAPAKTKIFNVVADAFGDKKNGLRK